MTGPGLGWVLRRVTQNLPPTILVSPPPAVGFGPADRSHLDSPEAREAMFLRRAAVAPQRAPILRPAFVPHVLQRADSALSSAAGGPRPMALRPPHQALVGPPLPGPPGPPMMLPPMARAPGPPLGSMAGLKPPLVNSAEHKTPTTSPCPLQVPEPLGEDKKKGKPEKLKRCIRTAAGSSWEDPSLLEWDADDFRIFCGDLGNEVNDDILARAVSRFPSFLKAKVIRDKRTGKTKGYGFVSFKDPSDYVRAMREMNGKYVGSRPIKLRKSMWKDRNLDVVRKKQKEKKKLGLR
ncbi:RNA-binding protein 42 isoform X1 [Cricetulus griseus]|uniref:RNA-binding protein 42 isoform X1 n=1 Tax=Cricetulus griseus TaxID=10029 RepID=UPI0015C3F257|nr:RNA-binding protein 42 isoform X1 [Cricetulus griseus]